MYMLIEVHLDRLWNAWISNEFWNTSTLTKLQVFDISNLLTDGYILRLFL
jgi:hypothetical protein